MLRKIFVCSAIAITLVFAGCSKKAASAGTAPAAAGSAQAPAKAAAVSRIRLATGGNTGTYYAYGSTLAQILQDKIGIPIVVSSTGASKANIQLIAAKEADMALVQNDVMDYAYKGTQLFQGQKIDSFYAVAGLYPETCQIVVNANAGIKSVADLKGKRVSVGDAGSGVEFNATQILAAYGITMNDIQKQNLSFGASADALRDGKIDAFFVTAGDPTPAIMDLATSKSIALLPIDDQHADAIIAKYPFYTKKVVPGGSYKGSDKDVQTLAVKATIICRKDLPDDLVYKFTKALFDNKDAIAAAHAKGKLLNTANAVSGISVPFDPGAEKYYKEVGAIK
jgi:TRAP transporter TAXI family solute receptor